MKKYILAIFLMLCFGELVVSNIYAANKTASEDKIIAVVNDDVITESELDNQLAIVKQQFAHAPSSTPIPSDKEMRSKILDGLINKSLELQLAKRNNISVSDEDVNNTIADIAKRNNITLEKMKSEIERQGMNFAYFRGHIKEQILLNKVEQQAFGRDIVVSDEEVAAFMKSPNAIVKPELNGALNPADKYHVIDILIGTDNNSTSKAKAEEIVKKLQDRKINFATNLKNIIAADSSVKSQDLDNRPLGAYPNIFIPEIAKMHPGDVVGPIEAPNGFHILYLISGGSSKSIVKEHHMTNDEAKAFLYKQKFDEKTKNWLLDLRSTAYIKIQ